MIIAFMDLPFRLAQPGEPFLLAADIDGTMLGDELGEAWLKAFKREAGNRFLLAYVTGRDFRSAMRLIDGQSRFQAGFDWDGQPRTLAAFFQRMAGLELHLKLRRGF